MKDFKKNGDSQIWLEKLDEKAVHISANRVCYIRKLDKDGYPLEDMGVEYCEDCVGKAIEDFEKEEPEYKFEYEIETSPEDNYFRTCEYCGKQLYHSLIDSKFSKDAVVDVVEELNNIQDFDFIDDGLAFRICEILDECNKFRDIFPDLVNKIESRVAELYSITVNTIIEEIFAHLEGIENTANRMTSGNYMHNTASIRLSARIVRDRLIELGITDEKSNKEIQK